MTLPFWSWSPYPVGWRDWTEPTKGSWQLLPSMWTRRVQRQERVGSSDTTGLSTDLEGLLGEEAVSWVSDRVEVWRAWG